MLCWRAGAEKKLKPTEEWWSTKSQLYVTAVYTSVERFEENCILKNLSVTNNKLNFMKQALIIHHHRRNWGVTSDLLIGYQ